MKKLLLTIQIVLLTTLVTSEEMTHLAGNVQFYYSDSIKIDNVLFIGNTKMDIEMRTQTESFLKELIQKKNSNLHIYTTSDVNMLRDAEDISKIIEKCMKKNIDYIIEYGIVDTASINSTTLIEDYGKDFQTVEETRRLDVSLKLVIYSLETQTPVIIATTNANTKKAKPWHNKKETIVVAIRRMMITVVDDLKKSGSI